MKGKFADMEDAELVEFFRDKSMEEKAVAEFYARYSRKGYGYCLKFLGNSDDASDVFQEGFVKFYKAAKDGQISGNPGAYLMVTLRNLSFNFLRDKKVVQTVGFEDYMAGNSGIWKDIEHNEKMQLLQNAIARLPAKMRDPFVLKQYNGYEIKEIAAIIGETEANTKTLIWRAKDKLKEMLKYYMTDEK